jgi:hypothetical protein
LKTSIALVENWFGYIICKKEFSTNAIEVFKHFQEQSKLQKYQQMVKENDLSDV